MERKTIRKKYRNRPCVSNANTTTRNYRLMHFYIRSYLYMHTRPDDSKMCIFSRRWIFEGEHAMLRMHDGRTLVYSTSKPKNILKQTMTTMMVLLLPLLLLLWLLLLLLVIQASRCTFAAVDCCTYTKNAAQLMIRSPTHT